MFIVAAFDPSKPTINTNLPVPLAGQGLTAGTGPGGQLTLQGQSSSGKYVVFNESSVSIGLLLPNGNTFYVPSSDRRIICASNWPNGIIQWWQRNITAGPALISEVLIEYYAPGEQITEVFPAPIVRQVASTVASTQTLSNEGNPSNTEVIDIGDVTFTKLIDIFNDGHANWSIDVSGTKHTIFQIALSGNFLQLGQSGDNVEVLGTLIVDSSIDTNTIRDNVTGVDQIDLATAGITINNPVKFASAALKFFTTGAVMVDGSDTHNLILNAPNAGGTGQVIFQKGGVNNIKIDQNGVNFPNGNFLPNISFFTGTGSGTYNHGFGGSPFWVAPIVDVSGSATQGYDSVTSTQVHVTLGASLGFKAFCG